MRRILATVTLGATLALAGVDHSLGEQIVVVTSATATSSGSMTEFGPAVALSSPTGYQFEYGTIVTGTPIVTGSGGGAIYNTWATVSHDLGETKNVSMAWRTRTLNESYVTEPGGHPTQPPLQMNWLYFGMASDVVSLTGFTPGEKFVLQMNYVPTQFDEAQNRFEAAIHVSWLNPAIDGGTWENATYGNSSRDPAALWNYDGSWAASGYDTKLGSWGVDTTNHVVWAVLDHNSEFAVAPEPAGVVMLATAAAVAGLAVHRRRPRRR